MSGKTLIIGSRGSRLAMEQARRVNEGLTGPSEIRVVKTSGDRFADQPLGEQNQVGFFTKEIEQELLEGRIDLAVHSLKDLPTQLASGLEMGAMLARDDAADILLVSPGAHDPDRAFPVSSGASVGASSLRRQSLLRSYRQDLTPEPIRGNVPTRIEKAQRGDFDAIIISRAGLERLALDVGELKAFEFNPRRWPGAPGQAVIAVEVREGDEEVVERLEALEDQQTRTRVQAERSLLVTYGGGCHTPFGAYSQLDPDGCWMVVAAPGTDGVFRVERFTDLELEGVRSAADQWIQSGCPERRGVEEDQWICRPARPWC